MPRQLLHLVRIEVKKFLCPKRSFLCKSKKAAVRRANHVDHSGLAFRELSLAYPWEEVCVYSRWPWRYSWGVSSEGLPSCDQQLDGGIQVHEPLRIKDSNRRSRRVLGDELAPCVGSGERSRICHPDSGRDKAASGKRKTLCCPGTGPLGPKQLSASFRRFSARREAGPFLCGSTQLARRRSHAKGRFPGGHCGIQTGCLAQPQICARLQQSRIGVGQKWRFVRCHRCFSKGLVS